MCLIMVYHGNQTAINDRIHNCNVFALYSQIYYYQINMCSSCFKFCVHSCESGFVQLVDGMEPVPRSTETQICGGNDRYSPPVVLFGDKGPASLIF